MYGIEFSFNSQQDVSSVPKREREESKGFCALLLSLSLSLSLSLLRFDALNAITFPH